MGATLTDLRQFIMGSFAQPGAIFACLDRSWESPTLTTARFEADFSAQIRLSARTRRCYLSRLGSVRSRRGYVSLAWSFYRSRCKTLHKASPPRFNPSKYSRRVLSSRRGVCSSRMLPSSATLWSRGPVFCTISTPSLIRSQRVASACTTQGKEILQHPPPNPQISRSSTIDPQTSTPNPLLSTLKPQPPRF
jgi:hypothetical protein